MSDPAGHDRADLVARALANSRVAQLVLDQDRRIVVASAGAGRLLGSDPADLAGQLIDDLMEDADAFVTCPDRECPMSGCFRSLTLRAGGHVPVEAHCSSFTDGHGRPCLDLVLHDARELEARDAMRSARLAKLNLLNQVNEALYGAQLSLPQVLESVLIAMTAGQGLRFNRAFLLLVNERTSRLKGEIAIGPSSREEADRIWTDLAEQPTDLYEMMTSYDSSLRETDVAVNNIVRHLDVDLADTDHVLIRALHSRRVMHITEEDHGHGLDDVRGWLGAARFAVAPLATRRGAIGVLIADNAISGLAITDLDLEFMQLFANQSANAIESSRLTEELARKVLDLRKAQQKQREDQQTLLRMERLSVMGETSAIVAHELRNPLVAIGGFARTLVRSLADDDPNRQFAEIIAEETSRLERIIHDLLDFIRPRKQMRKTIVIDQLVSETVARYLKEFEDKKIELRMNLKAGEIELNCHPGEIQQVLRNFLMNALQVMPSGGVLEVRSGVLDGGVRVSVLDEGPGFASDVAEKLFSPFFSTKASGSGLGLTICAQIIKAHGGVVNAANRPEGGAEFSFILPLPKEAEAD